MPRLTKHSYPEAGSFARVLEAAIALVDADTDDDAEYHRCEMRLRNAEKAHFLALGWTPPLTKPKPRRASRDPQTLELKLIPSEGLDEAEAPLPPSDTPISQWDLRQWPVPVRFETWHSNRHTIR